MLKVSVLTVGRDRGLAKAWLYSHIKDNGPFA